MERNQQHATFADSPLFRGLPPAALDDIAGRLRLQRYAPDETIVWQGEPSNAVYLIVCGIAAVRRMAAGRGESPTLAYLTPGETFGEVGVLAEQPRSATVVALTPLEAAVIGREALCEALYRYPSVAVEMARMLGHHLVDSDRRQLLGTSPPQVVVVFDGGAPEATAALNQALARMLAHALGGPVALTGDHDLVEQAETADNEVGYDLLAHEIDPELPAVVGATLLLDRVAAAYRGVVVALPASLDDASLVYLEQASQLLVVVPATAEGWATAGRLRARLARYTASGRAVLSVVAVGDLQEGSDGVDYALPMGAAQEHAVAPIVAELINRIGRTHQLAIYVPTTVAVDQPFDTAPFVERTLAFLGERFGGATSSPARGVWRSEMVGLVAEAVYIVQTYASERDLQAHLDGVINYVRQLKGELRQEAMALEVDRKLVLI